jgi:hypothetical protein
MKKGNRNAMKHGAFSTMIILPGEDPDEFRALHGALKKEWDPGGPTEHSKVFDIAKNLWRKRRLAQFHADEAKFHRQQLLWIEDSEIEGLGKFLDDVRAGKPKSELKMPQEWVNILNKYDARKDNESEDAWIQRLAGVVAEVREQLISQRGELANGAVVNSFCDEDAITAELALEERIDAKIDKDIVALGRMKTMQSMGLGRRRAGHEIEGEPIKRVVSEPIEDEEWPDDEELPEVDREE